MPTSVWRSLGRAVRFLGHPADHRYSSLLEEAAFVACESPAPDADFSFRAFMAAC